MADLVEVHLSPGTPVGAVSAGIAHSHFTSHTGSGVDQDYSCDDCGFEIRDGVVVASGAIAVAPEISIAVGKASPVDERPVQPTDGRTSPLAPDRKHMGVREFREFGYLQELNRRFLHPLGLALEVVIDDDGTERLGGVWDSRDDPEGFVFGDGIDAAKRANVDAEEQRRIGPRHKALGFWWQS